jgi:hypothetical protein
MSNENSAAQPAKVQLTVSGIQADLNNGLTRAAIQAKYSLTGKDLKGLFSHPKLKGLKTKPAPAFELVDDTPDVEEVASVEVEVAPAPVEVGTEEHTPNVENDFAEVPPTVTDEF